MVIDDGAAAVDADARTRSAATVGTTDGIGAGRRVPERDVRAAAVARRPSTCSTPAGTTGMPKGVVWRQEDIFFAAMGGGGWGAAPITHARGARRPHSDRRPLRRAVMLVIAPLMHGNAQWATWSASS